MINLKTLLFLILTAVLSIIFIFQFPYISNSRDDVSARLRNNSLSSRACTFYKWFDPNTNEREGRLLLKNCSACHMAYYKEWINDKHSMSQNNPFFLSIYKQFKQDHPDQSGNCALCHNPEAALDNNLEVDLTKISYKRTNGISCDFCHKIESIDQNPIKKGVAGLKVFRVCKGFKDTRFGPLKDPIQPSNKEELKYNSLFKTSLSCAKCHDNSNGNVQIYSTFTEWLNSPAAKKGIQCQSCHMLPRKTAHIIARSNSDKAISKTLERLPRQHFVSSRNDVNSIVDNLAIKYKKRPYYEVHSHSFLTENPHKFRKQYVDLKAEAQLIASHQKNTRTTKLDRLVVKITVGNNNSGHSFPTGSPMRNAILLVEVKDKNGNDLRLIKGQRLPNYAEDLRGKPGKLFAKILAETNSEYAVTHSKAGIAFRKIANEIGIPAQDWWNIFILSDSRIKANGNDISVYEFELPKNFDKVKVVSTLRWRNTWPGLAKLKGFNIKEDILFKKEFSLFNQYD